MTTADATLRVIDGGNCSAGTAHALSLNTLVQGLGSAPERYSGQEDIVFGTTVSGRPRPWQD